MSADCPIGSNGVPTAGTAHQPTPGVFYLDQENTAQCTGTIRRIRYCYYSNFANTSTESFEVRVSLYRRRAIRFNRESDEFVIRKSAPQSGGSMPGLVCEYLDLGMEVEVQERDVFGVCIPNSGANEALPIFSEVTGASLSTEQCDSEPPNSVRRPDLSTLNNVVLHIYADTSKIKLASL